MEKYQRGKIYKILNNINEDVYVGSTCEKLSLRMAHHRYVCKYNKHPNMMLMKTMNELGLDNFYIELIEDYPCSNKEQLQAKEGEWIRKISTLNRRVAGRKQSQYYQDNKEKVKTYVEQNIDKVREYKRKWYLNNPEKVQEYRLQCLRYITCDCGSKIKLCCKSMHSRTKKHQNYLNSLNDNNCEL
jgi:hypothetical protein